MSGATVVSTDNADLFQLVQWNLVETVQNTIDRVVGSTVQAQQHCLNMSVILVLQVAAQLLLTPLHIKHERHESSVALYLASEEKTIGEKRDLSLNDLHIDFVSEKREGSIV